jgi:deazaflavin-dependent oxidoreductase (nitroreductase family)
MLGALQRFVQRLASTRAGAWLFARTAHRLDLLLFRLSKGRYSLTGILAGLPVVTLTTIGARSGKPRTLPLVGIPDGEKVVLIASNFGRPHYPAWYHNLRANPEARLTSHGRAGTYIAHEAAGAERERYWGQAIDLYPGYTAYQARAGGGTIPVMVLTPKDGRGSTTILEENETASISQFSCYNSPQGSVFSTPGVSPAHLLHRRSL